MTKVMTSGLRIDRKQLTIRDQGSRVVRYLLQLSERGHVIFGLLAGRNLLHLR